MFVGSEASISSGRTPTVPDLLVDDANGPLPTLVYEHTRFAVDFTLTSLGAATLPTGQVLHSYSVDGTFTFWLPAVMSASIESGILTVLGDANSWGSSATIQASSLAGSNVTYNWNTDDQPAYNLFNGASTSEMTDVAFTLSNITSFPGGPTTISGVTIDPQTGLPNMTWQSEGSFSGSAFFVPAPGTAMIAGLGLAALGRRRRIS